MNRAATLLLRADADAASGVGHVMRGVALGEAWRQRGGRVLWATMAPARALVERSCAEGFEVATLTGVAGAQEDAAQVLFLARSTGAAHVCVDGYQFGLDYQRRLKAGDLRVLFVDDGAQAGEFVTDLVLDQNLGARAEAYARRAPRTELLLGPRYALLRREFRSGAGGVGAAPEVARRVLVTLGGSDLHRLGDRVTAALRASALVGLEVRIVAGPLSAPAQAGLAPAWRELRDVTNMAEWMAWADLAVSASGSTAWELACMGLPALLIVVADNQRQVAEALDTAGVATSLGWHADLTAGAIGAAITALARDPARRAAMSERGRRLVDGRGAGRVARALSPRLRLRRAGVEDGRLLWEWANDPVTRAASFSPAPIPWEDHQQWLERKLGDPDCMLQVAVNEDGERVGQFRLDVRRDEAVVSVSLAARFRGRRYAAEMIEAGCREAFGRAAVSTVRAYIREGNDASARAFRDAGFGAQEPTRVEGMPAWRLALRRAELCP